MDRNWLIRRRLPSQTHLGWWQVRLVAQTVAPLIAFAQVREIPSQMQSDRKAQFVPLRMHDDESGRN